MPSYIRKRSVVQSGWQRSAFTYCVCKGEGSRASTQGSRVLHFCVFSASCDENRLWVSLPPHLVPLSRIIYSPSVQQRDKTGTLCEVSGFFLCWRWGSPNKQSSLKVESRQKDLKNWKNSKKKCLGHFTIQALIFILLDLVKPLKILKFERRVIHKIAFVL